MEKDVEAIALLRAYAQPEMEYYLDFSTPRQKKLRYLTGKPAGKKSQGRNTLCACGSGLKYKKCCYLNDSVDNS